MALEKTSKNATVTTSTTTVSFEACGETHTLELWPMTWAKKKRAQDKATSFGQNPDTGKFEVHTDPGVFEEELAKALVKDSTIPGVPGEGWRLLHAEVGDALLLAIANTVRPSDDELTEAKNLDAAQSTGEAATSSTVESNTLTESGVTAE